MQKIFFCSGATHKSSEHASDIRLALFMSGKRKSEFLIGRNLLRTKISKLAKCEPQDIIFAKSGRRPVVIYPDGIEISLSHSKGCFLLAVSNNRVGVDLEPINRAPNALKVANRYFHASELAWLANDHVAALRLWVLKEACIKYYGQTVANNLAKYIFDESYNLLSSEICVQHWQSNGFLLACASKAGGYDFLNL